MQMHNHITTMPQSLECEAALSDLVLQAARSAVPKDAGRWFADTRSFSSSGPRNEPLLPLLIALLDATKTVAAAVTDNAWDDHRPVDRALVLGLIALNQSIADDLLNASSAPTVEVA
jgi:hypothetical protein